MGHITVSTVRKGEKIHGNRQTGEEELGEDKINWSLSGCEELNALKGYLVEIFPFSEY